ncbi:cell division protein FtsZ, partial [Defluviimonas sp. CAU 1641]|nr:cell division protein FtsZ [Defluviimonas salinarum]
ALARLQAAVGRTPGQPPRAAQPSPAAPRAVPAQQPQRQAEKPRFGINTLLNRMAGHNAEQAERTTPPLRTRPQVSAAYDEEPEVDPDQERIEIPAFLRRQAN